MSNRLGDIQWRVTPDVIEEALRKVLLLGSGGSRELAQLTEAMEYAVLGGGKRLRAQLVIEAAGAVCLIITFPFNVNQLLVFHKQKTILFGLFETH